MAADRKTGIVTAEIGGPVKLQVNFGKVAELERLSGKGIYQFTNDLYTNPMSITDTARLCAVFGVEPKLTENEWGQRLWENRRTFIENAGGVSGWYELVMDICEVVFDVDMRTTADTGEKKEPVEPVSPGGNSSETPVSSELAPASSGE